MVRLVQVLALILLAGTAALLGKVQPVLGKVDASTESLVLEDDPDAIRYDRTGLLFSNDEFVLVGLTREDLFTPEGVAAVASIHAELAAIPGVAGVLSPVSAPLFRSFAQPPRFPAQALMKPGSLADPRVDLKKAQEELTGHELFAGNIVSKDGKTAGFVVTLAIPPASTAATTSWLHLIDRRARARETLAAAKEPAARDEAAAALATAEAEVARFRPEWEAREVERKAQRIQVVNGVRGVVARARATGADVSVSGVPSLVVDMVEAIEKDLRTFLVGSAGFVLLFLALVFRRPAWVLLPMLAVATVVVSTVMLMEQLGIKMTVITANVPSLLLVLSLAHSIHLVVRWRELQARFPEEGRTQRVGRLVRGLVWPCLFTATTTVVGFSSLYYAGSRPIIDFGIAMAIGVGLSFVYSFLLLPAALLALPERDGSKGRQERQAEFLRPAGVAAVRHKWIVVAASLALVGAGWLGIRRLEVEARFIDYFKPGSPIQHGLLFIDDRLGGTSGLEVILAAREPGAQGTFGAFKTGPANLDAAAEVVAWLRARREVGVVMSYTGFLDELKKLFPQAGARGQVAMQVAQFPAAQPYIAPYLVLDEREAGGKKVGPYGATRIVARVKETDPALDRNALLKDVRAFLAEKFPADGPVEAEVTGMFVLYANMLASLVGSTLWTSLVTALAIYVMLSLLYRNPGAGLIALVPNLIPIVLVIGAMGFMGVALDMATVMIASVSMGIGVDCAIHYLFRFREEWRRTGDLVASVEASHASIGASIFWTSLTSVVGFAVLAFSEFLPNAWFGVFTGVAMIVSLAGMLLLIPAMLAVWNPFGREGVTKTV